MSTEPKNYNENNPFPYMHLLIKVLNGVDWYCPSILRYFWRKHKKTLEKKNDKS